MLNVFQNDAFSVVNLAVRINDLPYVPGQISRGGYFSEEGINTTYVAIEQRPEGLALVGPTPRGGPGETIAHAEDETRLFAVPHFQRDDSILADEVQNRREFGTDDQLESYLRRIDRKVGRHLRDFDATLEHQRVGAIKGIVTNKAGGVMFNLYTQFGITAPTPIVFDLDDENTNLQDVALRLTYLLEDALDTNYDGIDAYCGRDFWTKFTQHKYLRDAWKALQDRQRLVGGGEPNQMDLFDISWRRYRTGAKAQLANGNVPYIGTNEVRFVPRGVPDLFITRFAPADYEETVNQEGLPRYVKVIPKLNGKGADMEIQTNPINLCTRPGVLMSGIIGSE